MEAATLVVSFFIMVLQKHLLCSITGHETSVFLTDMESSQLASFKNDFSILSEN